MKKIILSLCLLVVGLPSLATCSIEGNSCTAIALPSNIGQSSNLNDLVPNNLENLTRTNAFQRSYREPYNDALIYMEAPSRSQSNPSNNYNSNCQFGVCLPGGEATSGFGGSTE